MSLAEAIQDSDELLLRRARKELLAFTLETKPDYEIGWHHRALAHKLDLFIRGEIRFLMVFMPPRHGKSELVSRRLPAFLHGLYPDCEIMAASYLDSLAGDMTIDIQNIIDSPAYKKIFPQTKIFPTGTSYAKGTRNSTEHNIIGRKGKYRGQGVGGSFTGKGANFIIIDDPIKGREVADSATFRDRLWNFYNNDLFSRLETNLESGRLGQVLITLTRWHEDDLAGRLLELSKKDPKAVQWDILNYPAIRTHLDDKTDRRQLGEALWPKKYGIEQLGQIRASAGERAWSSLYDQNPVPSEGTIFHPDMFEYVDPIEKLDWSFITADTAYKEKEENDFTVFTSFGVVGDQLYIKDVWRKQIKSSDIELPAAQFIQRQLGYGFRNTYIEPKGHGIYLNQKFAYSQFMIPGEEDLDEFYSDRRLDKVQRANNVAPHLNFRKVKIYNTVQDKETLVSECLAFPKGKHDDFVDTLIDGLKLKYGKAPTIFEMLDNLQRGTM